MKDVARALAPLFDPLPTIRASKIRFGKHLRISGVPAILVGAAAIVAAAGIARALPILPDAIREARLLVDSARAPRQPLQS
ncbi:MAG TPA: hypothetical protein VGD50_05100 [Candidatus Baltobacteraceae bacterium]